jgi:hypothetical protein
MIFLDFQFVSASALMTHYVRVALVSESWLYIVIVKDFAE